MVAFKNSTGIKANSSFCTFRFPTAEAHQLTKPFQYQPITTTSPTQPFAHFVFMPIVEITRHHVGGLIDTRQTVALGKGRGNGKQQNGCDKKMSFGHKSLFCAERIG